MNYVVSSWVWAGLEVLLVALAATIVSLLAPRRSPATGAAAAWAGVVAALWLTGMAFVPRPAVIGTLVVWPVSASASASPSAPTDAGQGLQADGETISAPALRMQWDAGLLSNVMRSLRNSGVVVQQRPHVVRWVATGLALCTMIGMARLICGGLEVAALRRNSVTIADGPANVAMEEMARRLRLRTIPQVRLTKDLKCAAVVGWREAVVLLPADWKAWSPQELEAVLAHELAHVWRRDAFWRFVAALAVAVHFGQPLLHWLRRQMLLAQEQAADELAAALVGNKRAYVQSLASLALRQDDQAEAENSAALLPVFSGFLLRRITMLRARDGSPRREGRLRQGIAVGLVGCVAVLATALRGLAEPAAKESDGSVRVATVVDRKVLPSATDSDSATEAAMFQRGPVDIARFANHKSGGMLIRVGEILRQSRFASMAQPADSLLKQALLQKLPTSEWPRWSIADIEYVVGQFNLNARFVPPKEPDADSRPHQIMFGSTSLFIRMTKPVNVVYDWFKRVPGAEEKQHGEFKYVELAIPAIGPVKSCFCQVDEHTLLWTGGEHVLRKQLDELAAPAEAQGWHAQWNEVDGGLVTAVAAVAEYKDAPAENLDETEVWTQDLFFKTSTKSFAADWQPNEGGHVSFRFQLSCDTQADAELIESHLRRALEKLNQDSMKASEKAADEKVKALDVAVEAYLRQTPKLEVRAVENGWLIDLRLSGPLPIESIR